MPWKSICSIKKRVKTRCLTQGGPLCILGLWGIIIFCCGGSLHIDITEKRGEGQVVTLTPADNGKTVDVHKGNKIVVQIDENLTTGYSWALDKDVGDSVSLQNSDFTPAGKAGIGAGGQRIFTFVACKEGAAVIKFKRWREWEGDKSIADRFGFTIRVVE